MRVLLTAPSSNGRLRNLVPLAWALRTAGHDVKIAGRQAFVETITRTGCVAVELGGDDEPGRLNDASAVDELVDFAKLWRPAVVVSDEQALAGAVAARAAGAAAVRMVGVFDQPARTEHSAGVAEVSGQLGDSPARHGVTVDEALVLGDLTLDSLPASLRDCTAATGIRFVPYTGPVVVPTWLRRRARRSRMLLTLTDATLFGTVFDAVAGLDVEVVCAVAADRFEAGTTVPPNVRLVDSAPPLAVLPTCAAVLHDADPDSAITALAYRLPQLSLVSSPLAERIADAGAGLVAGPPASLTEQLAALLADESLCAGADALGEEIAAMPNPRDLVPVLVELAAHR